MLCKFKQFCVSAETLRATIGVFQLKRFLYGREFSFEYFTD